MSDERHDEKRQGSHPSKQGDQEAKKSAAETTAVSTSDPAIKSGPDMGGPPEQVVSYQTSHLSTPPNPYPFEPGGDVVQERRDEQKGDASGGRQQRDHDGGERRTKRQRDEQGKKGGDEHGKKQQNGQQGGNEHGNSEQGESHKDTGRGRDDETSERPRKKKRHKQVASAVNWKTLVMSAALALVCGVGGAWGYSAFFGPSNSDKQDKEKKDSDKGQQGKSAGRKSAGKESGKPGSGSGSNEGGASASEIPGFSSAKDADTFRKELEHLSHRLDLLSGRIDQITQPATQTPPVLHTLQEKVNELEREVDRVANLPHRLEQLQQKLLSTRQEFKMLKERVSGEETPLGGEVSPAVPEANRPLDSHAVPLGSEPIGTTNPAEGATFKLAIGLFRQGHYTRASDVLRRLQRERPQDARVWYYSALAHGMATGEWSGKTKQLAEQGVACEKAGEPSRDEIDSALSNLPSGRGKDWLADQRQQTKNR